MLMLESARCQTGVSEPFLHCSLDPPTLSQGAPRARSETKSTCEGPGGDSGRDGARAATPHGWRRCSPVGRHWGR